ncbi:4Fe-4S dicluster domain-containing protein [Myxococcus sp. MISCRS1]|uniref:4Fe-4S dicluster domain-containing protein n=1 Tax=Myxococcus TaxID=32 RepID=UPI001CC13777|nr:MULTISPECIES: 4Fe-4S dicluster domain-containing protein [unclassified Myxococcus]MBZ4397350.1 4Fe-4S dicluster domain-containing protein [Myxococcus sp. AS-1-15]MBZ4410679.1 4Fe-4S dicluster domain-containing protein [Myxococcus sp. XM-1-1-1]MCY1003824.1 4Fe-4S dicluster domain-containing protein [Myxococcus sp. MISCRS1]BDT34587.1 4Fe-4S dicluster domain-containing protein [Myxococcus sp. MH1]
MSRKGFFTDSTVCIGCKACEVACKQWNQLPDDGFHFTGMSYDQTGDLGCSTWRHVAFVERPVPMPGHSTGVGDFSWLMVSDVCKHCQRAGCLEACPTGAIVRTEFDTVYVQPDVCNGCGYCVVGCPFGVIDRRPDDGRAWKCTLCYDRIGEGMTPACAKACPTESIVYGDLDVLHERADNRLRELHSQGIISAYLYGKDATNQPGTGGLNAFFLLVDRPEVYNLPPDPVVPTMKAGQAWGAVAVGALGMAAMAVGAVLLGRRGNP